MNEQVVTFFIICPIGFEDLCFQELISKWNSVSSDDPPHPETVIGGVEFSCNLQSGLLLNKVLKLPSRILIRVDTFKARDFPKLFKKVSKIDWSPYLVGQNIVVKATAHESRLMHSKRIEKTVSDGISKFYKKTSVLKEENSLEQTVYIRLQNDICTISLDTSGDLLHIRERQKNRGKASLRENIASALLQHLVDQCESTENYTLIDPMCGSGTFLFESEFFWSIHDSKKFPFYDWPVFDKKEIQKPTPLWHFAGHKGFDNFEEILISNKEINSHIDFEVRDVFKTTVENAEDCVVILNPPYGKRIPLDRPPSEYYNDLVNKILKTYKPYKLGIIIPKSVSAKRIQLVEKYEISDILDFNNNGIKVRFVTFSKR